MSDERLREVERRWKETGSVEDEAKYLLERVRVGDLEQEMLELAAYCEHDGARAALASAGVQPPTLPKRLESTLHATPRLEGYVHLKDRWGTEPQVRAYIALSISVFKEWRRADQSPAQQHTTLLMGCRGAIAAARHWVLGNDRPTAAAIARSAAERLNTLLGAFYTETDLDAVAMFAHRAAATAGGVDVPAGVLLNGPLDDVHCRAVCWSLTQWALGDDPLPSAGLDF